MAGQKNDIFTGRRFAKFILICLILFGFEDQVLLFKSEKDIDKAEDRPAEPIGDLFINKMKTINNNYKDNIDEDIMHLSNFGHISTMSGDFVFNVCKECGGPMIGHEKEEKDCKEKRMDYEMIGRLQDEVLGNCMFESFKAAIDKRQKEIKCKECDKIFVNRLQREQHDKSVHGGMKAKEMSGFAQTFTQTFAQLLLEV